MKIPKRGISNCNLNDLISCQICRSDIFIGPITLSGVKPPFENDQFGVVKSIRDKYPLKFPPDPIKPQPDGTLATVVAPELAISKFPSA